MITYYHHERADMHAQTEQENSQSFEKIEFLSRKH